MNEITSCIITDFPVEKFRQSKILSGKKYFGYDVTINGIKYKFDFCDSCFEYLKPYIEQHKILLKSHFLNGKKMNLEQTGIVHDFEPYLLHKKDFEKFIKETPYPILPSEKIDTLFMKIASLQKFDGEKMRIRDRGIYDDDFWKQCYFKSNNELLFYLKTLSDDGKLDLIFPTGFKGETFSWPSVVNLTYEGLLHSIRLNEEGSNSDRCFVAMSFNEADKYLYYDAIQPVCAEFNFKAIRVDFLHPGSENTINDLIIAELKKSRFCIADFTNLKAGVYFEAGYALGRGKKVIYTCHKKDFPNLHFDINHYPILIYESIEEYKQLLRNKIEAFILD